jgi:hypothetical protein
VNHLTFTKLEPDNTTQQPYAVRIKTTKQTVTLIESRWGIVLDALEAWADQAGRQGYKRHAQRLTGVANDIAWQTGQTEWQKSLPSERKGEPRHDLPEPSADEVQR